MNRPAMAISLVFSRESYFCTPFGAGSLAVGRPSGCVLQPRGHTNSGMSNNLTGQGVNVQAELSGEPSFFFRLDPLETGVDEDPLPSLVVPQGAGFEKITDRPMDCHKSRCLRVRCLRVGALAVP